MATETGAVSSDTETGLDENLAGALAYILGLITGVLFLVIENDNRFIRFHAAQSIALHVAFIVLWIVLSVIQIVLGSIPGIGGVMSMLFNILIWMGVGLGGLALWLFVMYKAYNHEEFHLPVVGDIADNIASK